MFGRRVSGGAKSESNVRRRDGVSDSTRSNSRSTGSDISNRNIYRRNRTLTGSSSSNIASSNELNAELKSPRAHVHHLTSLRRRLMSYFVGVALVSFGLYILVSQLVATTAVLVDAEPSLDSKTASRYSRSFESYYAARPAERFKFLLDEPALLSHVRSAHPEVKSIRLEPGSKLGEASVVLQSRQPLARWSLDSSNQYVDGDGVVFTVNYHDEPDLQIVDESGIGAVANGLVASDRFLGFIGIVVAKARVYGIDVEKVTIPSLTTRQVALSINGQGTQYRMSVDRSPGEQVEDISKISRYLQANSLNPEYVDVRVAGKAYYR